MVRSATQNDFDNYHQRQKDEQEYKNENNHENKNTPTDEEPFMENTIEIPKETGLDRDIFSHWKYLNLIIIFAILNMFLGGVIVIFVHNGTNAIRTDLATSTCSSHVITRDLTYEFKRVSMDHELAYEQKSNEILNKITKESNTAHNSIANKLSSANKEIDFLANKVSDLARDIHELTRASRENLVVMPCTCRDKSKLD